MIKIKPIVLPKDNGPHDFGVEWWYFNGHLQDKGGKKYSFMDCFFKVNLYEVGIPHILPHMIEEHLKNGEYIHFAHSVISNISNKKSFKEVQNISLISKDSFKKKLLYIAYKDPIDLYNISNSEIIETTPNNFYIKTKNLNLNLVSNKKPLLEGGHGYVGTPKAGSYYYSLTDLSVKGNINIEGKEIEVEGKAWMDHQWANVVYKKDKWTWFSFQFDNGTEIMFVEYDKGGGEGIDTLIDIIDKNGKQTQYKKAIIKPSKKIWESEETKAKYPLSWNIEIPGAGIKIKVDSLLKDQEIIFGQINYWEGPVKVTAIMNGNKINGNGFMELVGYPSDYNYLLIAGKEFEKNIEHKVEKLLKNK